MLGFRLLALDLLFSCLFRVGSVFVLFSVGFRFSGS